MKKKKNPWIAAILNFFIPGLGYLYLKKRQVFGLILILVEITAILEEFIYTPIYEDTPLTWIAVPLVLFAFGYDAYNEAK